MNTPEAWLKTHNELQSASFHVVICINLHGNLTQVTAQDDRSEGIEVIKWLRTGMEMASHRHGNGFTQRLKAGFHFYLVGSGSVKKRRRK